MRLFMPCRLSLIALALPLACGSAEEELYDNPANAGRGFDDLITGSDDDTATIKATPMSFPGAGTSGAARPLTAALAPETSGKCDPEPSTAVPVASTEVQTVCFYGADSPNVPAALIEQVVEVVGTAEWVHIRLTLNPDFVDNTYGDTAIGWQKEAGAPSGGAQMGPAAPPGGGRANGGARQRGKKSGHTFQDLLGSDHAELQLLDQRGVVAMHFKLDYISEAEAAASGFASLGVSDGEGELILGEPEWVLASATSIDRNLNACGLGSFIESSPATDAAYTLVSSAPNWDYRVVYEIWISTDAFGGAGFGSALIENVHASPSKLDGNTVDVSPAPCPIDPETPDAAPVPVPVVLQNIR